MSARPSSVVVVDFGSQYTQLIARRIRELEVFCEVVPFSASLDEILSHDPKALVLSGGPASVFDKEAPALPAGILNSKIPKLGICYGLQSVAIELGGKVARAGEREYGAAQLQFQREHPLFSHLTQDHSRVWMSHSDQVQELPDGALVIAKTASCPFAAIEVPRLQFYGLQFHPEVVHSLDGMRILEAFLFEIAGLNKNWRPVDFVEQTVAEIQKTVGSHQAICGLSGGVDSSVAAVLVQKAIGENLTCIFVDNGLLRSNEAERVMKVFASSLALKVIHVDASEDFLAALEGVTDPEEKRKVIGRVFVEVFDREAQKLDGDVEFLVQGTLYPDVIESVSVNGPSAVIKSHHNVGGLPERMKLKLIEPLRMLFKDEVRRIGAAMGMPAELLGRQPFPGPGLAVRCPGLITTEKLRILREADAIFAEEIRDAGLYDKIWQSFAVLVPVKTVGVMGDERTFDFVVALRAVDSSDGMTADWSRVPYEVLAKTSSRIINEVEGCNRVVYDISSKPPATIEWE